MTSVGLKKTKEEADRRAQGGLWLPGMWLAQARQERNGAARLCTASPFPVYFGGWSFMKSNLPFFVIVITRYVLP